MMRWWQAALGVLVAGAIAAPAMAQEGGLTLTLLAEGRQAALPVGPLVWQGFEYVFPPGDRAQVFGEDAGFTLVVDGVAQFERDEPAPVVIPAGTAVATQSGVRRRLAGTRPTGARVWVIGLGGPTPGAYQMPPRLLFRSEPIVPPGGGSFVLRLEQIELTGLGELAPSSAEGTITLFVREGNVSLQTPEGSAVVRKGSVTTVATRSGVRLAALGERPARLLALSLLAGAPTVSVPTAPPALETQPNPAPIPFPLLPSGTFPRSER
jgi:hypothetical protein